MVLQIRLLKTSYRPSNYLRTGRLLRNLLICFLRPLVLNALAKSVSTGLELATASEMPTAAFNHQVRRSFAPTYLVCCGKSSRPCNALVTMKCLAGRFSRYETCRNSLIKPFLFSSELRRQRSELESRHAVVHRLYLICLVDLVSAP